jgi:hypothetical protein
MKEYPETGGGGAKKFLNAEMRILGCIPEKNGRTPERI